MSFVLFFVECVEVAGEGLGHDGFRVGLGGHGPAAELEGLVHRLVSRFEVEPLRLVVGHPDSLTTACTYLN